MKDVTLKGNRVLIAMVDLIREAKIHNEHGSKDAVKERLITIELMINQMYEGEGKLP